MNLEFERDKKRDGTYKDLPLSRPHRQLPAPECLVRPIPLPRPIRSASGLLCPRGGRCDCKRRAGVSASETAASAHSARGGSLEGREGGVFHLNRTRSASAPTTHANQAHRSTTASIHISRSDVGRLFVPHRSFYYLQRGFGFRAGVGRGEHIQALPEDPLRSYSAWARAAVLSELEIIRRRWVVRYARGMKLNGIR